jgi:PEP-CTERM motif
MRSSSLLGITALFATSALVAYAGTIDDFVIAGTNNPTLITFSLPANPQNVIPVIGAGGADGGFELTDAISYNGQTAEGDFQFISYFYPGAAGISISSPIVSFIAQDQALYSGPSSNPTFLIGTFEESEYDWANPGDFNKLLYTVTITPEDSTPSSTPEPSTFALLATGIGVVAAARRYHSSSKRR